MYTKKNWFVIVLSHVHSGNLVTKISHLSPLEQKRATQNSMHCFIKNFVQINFVHDGNIHYFESQKLQSTQIIYESFYEQFFVCQIHSVKIVHTNSMVPRVSYFMYYVSLISRLLYILNSNPNVLFQSCSCNKAEKIKKKM